MFRLFSFFRGHVRVGVAGFAMERFMNMVAFHGVYIWDIVRTGYGCEFSVSIKGFRMLRRAARKTGSKVRIVAKHGLPFTIFKYRRRKVLAFGSLVFLLGLFVLSGFLWRVDIEIENADNPPAMQLRIQEFLDSSGIHPGVWRRSIDEDALSQQLISHFPDIAYANVHVRGTHGTVHIVAGVPHAVPSPAAPAHVFSVTDGVITDISTAAGAPLVRIGDVVRAGDMLVSGILQLDPEAPDSPLVYVAAAAEIWARRYHEFEFSVPLSYEHKVFTGETARRYALQLLFRENWRINIPMGSISFTSYDRITTYRQPGVGARYPMPLIIATTHYAEFAWQQASRTREDAHAYAQRLALSRLLNTPDFSGDILEQRIHFTNVPGAVHARALIITNERIDRTEIITVPTPEVD
jgi:similar to stage IV sporulation protein